MIVNVPLGPSPDFSSEAIRSLLELKFRAEDQERVDFLTAKAQAGSLTPEEQAELEKYIRVADRLARLKSSAALWLEKTGLDQDEPGEPEPPPPS